MSSTSPDNTKYPPFSQIGRCDTGVMPVTAPESTMLTQWNEDWGGTINIDAAAPDSLTSSMMSFIGASVSTSE